MPMQNLYFPICSFNPPHESSLQLVHRAGQSKLKDLLRSADFLNLEELSQLPETAEYVCDSKRNLHVWVDDTPMHIDDLLKENGVLNQHLDELCDYAGKAGGYIYSSGDINIEQWLRFYGHPIPSTVRQLANLLSFLKKERPTLSASASYHELLEDPDTHPTALSLFERERIQAVTKSLGAGNTGQLLGTLLEQAISTPKEALRFAPLQHIADLTGSEIGKTWARGYLTALEWYGTQTGESPSQEDLRQLLITAILLNLDPKTSVVNSKCSVMGFELYKPANADRHPAQILVDLENHLSRSGAI